MNGDIFITALTPGTRARRLWRHWVQKPRKSSRGICSLGCVMWWTTSGGLASPAEEKLKRFWMSLLGHVCNEHTYVMGNCKHALPVEPGKGKTCLSWNSPGYKLLRYDGFIILVYLVTIMLCIIVISIVFSLVPYSIIQGFCDWEGMAWKHEVLCLCPEHLENREFLFSLLAKVLP